MSQPYLTQRLRAVAQPQFRFRQFVDVKEAIGKNRGDTWLYDKRGNVSTQGTVLSETNTIPQTQFVVGQGTGIVVEYANSVPYTGKLEALGQIMIEPAVEQALRDDMVKALESAAGSQYINTEFIAVMSATNSVVITTNGTATATATADLTAFNVQSVVNFMKKKLIPKYDGQSYICIASTSALAGMFTDASAGGWVDVSKYQVEFAKNIFNGEIGKYYNTRFVEETGFFSNTIGSGSTHGAAVFFGADSVYEAVTIPEEIRVKVSIDFGRDQALAWYFLGGWKTVWSWSATPAEQHIVYVTSA
ncbi:MAG: N4-gp56 family major capsid protein [Thaumarchaeota archaeon]|nr:N4-gp56 family major capsid protein [Nitrososphaerota archaeon]